MGGDEGDEARDRPCQGRGAEGHEGDEARERHCQEGRGPEGHEGDEAREHPCQGRGPEGHEGDEAREHPGQGRGAEGHEGDEAREHPGQGRGGAGGDEGDEVSWRMSTLVRPPRTPGGCASSDMWVSPHSRGAWARTGVSRRARTRVAVYAHL